MKTQTMKFLRTTALSLVTIASQASQAENGPSAIVDIRFDAPYKQIEPSMGDEWAPTWGGDDVLYTGNNDGSSFGNVAPNTIAFGKLEGSDPYELKGTTINRMQDFREGQFSAESAKWKVMDTYKIGAMLYRFVPCGFDADLSLYSCLRTSSDDGKSWTKDSAVGGDAALFRGTRFGAPTFISFREDMGMSDRYALAASYAGVIDSEDNYLVGRVPIEKLAQKSAADWSFQQRDWTWNTALDGAARTPNSTALGHDGANWKTMNTYSVDGVLYMFVTRCVYPLSSLSSSDPKRRHIFQHSSIIKSIDSGRTWTRPAEVNFEKPMFPGKRFGTAYFVWYGKDGAASVDNADRYVYAVSNNGHFENGDDYVIGRVLKSKLSDLSAEDWSFYINGDGMQDASWTPKLGDSRPILTNPGRSSMTGMTYIEDLRRYVMVSWHYNHDNFEAAIAARDLSTVLEFFEAPKPWGPWTKIKTFKTGHLGWFAPIIGQRFQTASDSNTVNAFLYTSGFRTTPEGDLDSSMYKLNYLPISLSTKPLQQRDPAFVGSR